MKEKKKRSNHLIRIRKLLLVISILMLVLAGIVYVTNQPPQLYINPNGDDLLFYTAKSNMLTMYNPRTNEKQALMPRPDTWQVSFDGQIAFQGADKTNITVADVESVGQKQAIIASSYDEIRIISWSPEGHYLLYGSGEDRFSFNRIYVWDGEESFDLTPREFISSEDNSENSYLDAVIWSDKEQLAFVYTKTVGDYKLHRIYIWDGEQTIDITPEALQAPINTNGTGRYERGISTYIGNIQWSSKQHIAFELSYTDDEGVNESQHSAFVWDGQTVHTLGDVNNQGWSAEGQLMVSYGYNNLPWDRAIPKNNQSHFVKRWDGETYENGQPHLEIIPELDIDDTTYYAFKWAYGNTILYLSDKQENSSQRHQYLWDGENLRYFDWRDDNLFGKYWHFNERGEGLGIESLDPTRGDITRFTTTYLYLHDPNNNPITTINGYRVAWSKDGYISFCPPSDLISIYNGYEVIVLEDFIGGDSQWQSGGRIWCSITG